VRRYRLVLTHTTARYSENIVEPPLLGEPLPLELANTRFKRRGVEHDGLATPEALAAWLARVGERLPFAEGLDAVGAADHAAARALRDALRTLFAGAREADAVATVNATIRAAPTWQELSPDGAVTAVAAPGVPAALALIAQQAVLLLSGPDAGTVRACAGPECMLFYRKDHPRRAWCSPRCSDRARAARHYARRTR
jgi:predicted RNA-binding Zn ribbon-like protein